MGIEGPQRPDRFHCPQEVATERRAHILLDGIFGGASSSFSPARSALRVRFWDVFSHVSRSLSSLAGLDFSLFAFLAFFGRRHGGWTIGFIRGPIEDRSLVPFTVYPSELLRYLPRDPVVICPACAASMFAVGLAVRGIVQYWHPTWILYLQFSSNRNRRRRSAAAASS